MPSPVTHFEIFADDAEKLADFYRELFGWQIEKAIGVDYFRIRTAADGDGSLQGGLLPRPIAGPKSWVHYVHVDSLDDAIARVERLGGTIVRAKAAVPKTAWYAVVEDPQGNIFALYQRDPNAFPSPEAEL